MRRAALYMRVSTKNHGQTTETQALALRDYAAHRGFTIVEEYPDEGISGSKDSRPALDKLMRDARARRFDVVVVARFDRFARSVSHLLRALEEFGHLGVDFVSVSESINTSTPMGKMIFTVWGRSRSLNATSLKSASTWASAGPASRGRHWADRNGHSIIRKPAQCCRACLSARYPATLESAGALSSVRYQRQMLHRLYLVYGIFRFKASNTSSSVVTDASIWFVLSSASRLFAKECRTKNLHAMGKSFPTKVLV